MQSEQVHSRHPENLFSFLKKQEKHDTHSFFSEKNLAQDIFDLTNAEPDIPLQCFYALYHTLWPQIEEKGDTSLKDAWNRFLGTSFSKGILYAPEMLITEKKPEIIINDYSGSSQRHAFSKAFEEIIANIVQLREKLKTGFLTFSWRKEIIECLIKAEKYYMDFQRKVINIIRSILQDQEKGLPIVEKMRHLEYLFEPKAVMLSDIFDEHWAYRISRQMAKQIMSLDDNKQSLHRVTALPQDGEKRVYFKAKGNSILQSHKGYMLESLYTHLMIPISQTGLLIFTNIFDDDANFYTAQASEAVIGELATEALKKPETVLKQDTYTQQVFGAIVKNDSEETLQNLIYSQKYSTLINIHNNNMIFVRDPKGEINEKVNINSALFKMTLMENPVPTNVQAFFATMDPQITLLLWLNDLSRKNRAYETLFKRLSFQQTRYDFQHLLIHDEIPTLANKHMQVNSKLHPYILVSEGLVKVIKHKLEKIQRTCRDISSVTPQTIFERASPFLAKYYQGLRYLFRGGQQELLEDSWKTEENSKDYSYLSSLLRAEDLEILVKNSYQPSDEDFIEQDPSLLLEGDFRSQISSSISAFGPLSVLIQRYGERLKKSIFNPHGFLTELGLLIDEGWTQYNSIKDIVDMFYLFRKEFRNTPLIKEFESLVHSLPDPELKWWLLTTEEHFIRIDDHSDISSKALPPHFVSGAFLRRRILSEPLKNHIFDQNGKFKRDPSLTCFPPDNPVFFLKKYPEWPGYESASMLLMRLLGLNQLPYHDLLIISHDSAPVPILLTEKISGSGVFQIWDNDAVFSKLDPYHTGLLILSAMLLNPEDGKEDNFILSPDWKYLIPINNDHNFLPSILRQEKVILTKTLLFCLDEMDKPIPSKVVEHFLSINFDQVFIKFMTELVKVQDKYQNLVDQPTLKRFLENGTVLRIPLHPQFIDNLYWKAHQMQNILRTSSNLTPFDLLTNIEPYVAKCYKAAFTQHRTLKDRFIGVTKDLYTKPSPQGLRLSVLNAQKMIEILDVSKLELEGDAVFCKMGPSSALDHFTELIEETKQNLIQNETIEKNFMYELDEEKLQASWIDVFGKPPSQQSSLKDLFTNTKEAVLFHGSSLITDKNLATFFSQEMQAGIKIRFLSLRKTPFMTKEVIAILSQECPNLVYLNISDCMKLTEIRTLKGVWPLLIRLEANRCPDLKEVASYSPLRVLRIGSSFMVDIHLKESCPDVLSISTQKPFFGFNFVFDQKTGIKVTFKNKELIEKDVLKFCYWYLYHLDTHSNTSFTQHARYLADLMKSLWPRFEHLSKPKTERLPYEEIRNRINPSPSHEATIGNETMKWFVEASFNRQKQPLSLGEIELELFGLAQLTVLNLSRAALPKKTLEALVQKSNWPNLTQLDLSFNNAEDDGLALIVKKNWSQLTSLNLHKTNITKKGIAVVASKSNWPKLASLDLSYNNVEDEGLALLMKSNLLKLSNLNLRKTGITKKGIEKIAKKSNWSITHLDISFNNIGDEGLELLTIAHWPQLHALNLRKINITNLSVKILANGSSWPNLTSLDISHNEITDNGFELLTMINWPQLSILNLRQTSITKLSVAAMARSSCWTKISNLDLSDNNITDDGLEILTTINWPQLKILNLCNTGITSIEAIATKSRWFKLLNLGISDNQIVEERAEMMTIQEALPQLKINRDEEYLIKLMLLGDSGVGKTCLLRRYVDNVFPTAPSESVEFAQKTVNIDGKKLKIQICDAPGQKNPIQMHYKGVKGFILCYAINSTESFQAIEEWIQGCHENGDKDACKILVGTHCDVVERKISFEEGQGLAKKYSIKFLETSSKEAINVKEIFYFITNEIKQKFIEA